MPRSTSDRVEFRLPPELKEEIETASALLGVTTSAFVKDAAIRAARQTIREERQIRLGDEAWERFSAAVERPGEYNEGFARLLQHPSLFADR